MKIHVRRVGFMAVLMALTASLALSAGPKTCGAPRRAAPQRRKGGESFPPLPLPATPLRRTEKKRPPAPPALVGKVQYGKVVWVTDEKTGRRSSYRDWTAVGLRGRRSVGSNKHCGISLDSRWIRLSISYSAQH